jgi:uncharacterized membrane protein (DUF373 family)
MSTRAGRRVPSRIRFDLRTGIVRAESAIYPVIGLLLVAAAALTLIGTVVDVIEGSHSRPVTDVGVFLLERILLFFIIAELLHTLRLVDFGGTILVEPFLFIGLIAVVRRILLITAEAEGAGGPGDVTGFLVEIGVLGALTLALAISIHLLRRSRVSGDE